MFEKATQIDSAFRHIRLFTATMVGGSLLVLGFALYENHKVIRESQERIFILAGGKALEAFESTRRENIPVEARDHIRSFHQFFFSLDPDEKVIGSHITRALYLADASAKREYDNLKESGYYSNLIAGNISQQLEIDSIRVDTESYPYYFTCTAREKLIRTTSIVTRNLVTEGYLRQVDRSDNNPHGFLIERWRILDNRDLKIEPR